MSRDTDAKIRRLCSHRSLFFSLQKNLPMLHRKLWCCCVLVFFKPWKHVFEWEVITEIKWLLLAGVHTAFLEEISHSSTLSHSHPQFEHIQFCWSQRHNYLLQAHLVSATFSINAFTSFPAVPQAVLKSHKMQLSRSILKTQNSRLLRL